jgi:hypothetical protein
MLLLPARRSCPSNAGRQQPDVPQPQPQQSQAQLPANKFPRPDRGDKFTLCRRRENKQAGSKLARSVVAACRRMVLTIPLSSRFPTLMYVQLVRYMRSNFLSIKSRYISRVLVDFSSKGKTQSLAATN